MVFCECQSKLSALEYSEFILISFTKVKFLSSVTSLVFSQFSSGVIYIYIYWYTRASIKKSLVKALLESF